MASSGFPSACIFTHPHMHPAGCWTPTSCQDLCPRPGATTHPPSLPSQRCECIRSSLSPLALTAPRLLVLANSSWRLVAYSQDSLMRYITHHADLSSQRSGPCICRGVSSNALVGALPASWGTNGGFTQLDSLYLMYNKVRINVMCL